MPGPRAGNCLQMGAAEAGKSPLYHEPTQLQLAQTVNTAQKLIC